MNRVDDIKNNIYSDPFLFLIDIEVDNFRYYFTNEQLLSNELYNYIKQLRNIYNSYYITYNENESMNYIIEDITNMVFEIYTLYKTNYEYFKDYDTLNNLNATYNDWLYVKKKFPLIIYNLITKN